MPRRNSIFRLLLSAIVVLLIIIHIPRKKTPSSDFRIPNHKDPKEDISCPPSNLANDISIVLRTGATESLTKLPAHLHTILRCTPHFTIYSDYTETISGHKVHNILDSISEEIKSTDPDFEHYNHLQIHGRKGLDALTSQSGTGSGGRLNTQNPGWRLDKWKFLPMVDAAFRESPSAKWFVFIEPDTYFVWANLLEYLSHLDPTKELYLGKHMYMDAVQFAYGGAGIILSNPAVRKVSEHRSVRIREYENFTAEHWAGDAVLAKALGDVGIELFRAFPHMQGDPPATLDPKTTKMDRVLWCYPAVTFHHVLPLEVEDLWRFEQDWFGKHSGPLRYRDIFTDYILPKLGNAVSEWDNLSDGTVYSDEVHSDQYSAKEKEAHLSFEHCQAVCESRIDCLQFSYAPKRCSVSTTLKLGYAQPGKKISSGWILDRISATFRQLDESCGVRDWYLP